MSVLAARIDLFERGGVRILADVRLNIEKGQHWIVLGPNGSGKSTLVKLLTMYEWPTEGTVLVEGRSAMEQPAAEVRKRVGLFEPALQLEIGHHYPWVTAEEIVLTGRTGALMLFNSPDAEDLDTARRMLLEEGFDPSRAFSVMSSGEQRRTLLLRSLFAKPAVLILDEPYESLDIKARWGLERNIVRYMGQPESTTVTALHRFDEIPPLATHCCLMSGGRVNEAGRIDEVLDSESVSRLYDVSISLRRENGRFHYEPGP